MAVFKHARNLPVRGHWLKIQLLVFVEVHEREVAADLAKTPLDRLPHLAHGKVVPRLTCSERRPFVRDLEGGVPVGVAAVAEHVEEVGDRPPLGPPVLGVCPGPWKRKPTNALMR